MGHLNEGALKVGDVSNCHGVKGEAQRRCRSLHRLQRKQVARIRRIPEHRDTRGSWKSLLEELKPLRPQVRVRAKGSDPSHVRTGPGQARDKPQFNWIEPNSHHDNGDHAARSLGSLSGGSPIRDDDIAPQADEFTCQFRKPLHRAFGVAKLHRKVLPLNIITLAELASKCLDQARIEAISQMTNPPHLPCLLPLGSERRGEEHRTRASEDRATVYH